MADDFYSTTNDYSDTGTPIDFNLMKERLRGDPRPVPPTAAYSEGWTGEKKPEPLILIRASDLAGKPIPERKWIVPGLIPDRNVTDLSGDGGDGKSLLALQLGVAMATGTDWIGFMPEPGGFLYVSCEDEEAEIQRRLGDICKGRGFGFEELGDFHVLDMTLAEQTEIADLDKNGNLRFTAFRDQLFAKVEEIRPKLMVLDTRADVFAAAESNRAQVRKFVRELRRLCFRLDMAVLLISHPSLTGISTGTGQSGSTAWNASVRSRAYLEKVKAEAGDEPDPALRRLSTKKANYGSNDQIIMLRWSEGRFRPDQGAGGFLDRAALERKANDAFLRLLREFALADRYVGTSPAVNFAPTAFNKADKSISKKAFEAAMERLFKDGKIRMGKTPGPPSKQRDIIVEVTGS